MTGVLVRSGKFEHRHTGRTTCEDEDRDGRDTAARQQTRPMANHHQKLRREQGKFSLESQGEHADIWISDF